MDDEPFAEFSTVLFKKDQTTTVVPTNSLRTDGKGKTSAKWKNKWMEVRVVDQSDDERLLRSRKYDKKGNLIEKKKGSQKGNPYNDEILDHSWIGEKTKAADSPKVVEENKTDVKKSSSKPKRVGIADDVNFPATSSARGREKSGPKVSRKVLPEAFSDSKLKRIPKTETNTKQSQGARRNQIIDESSDEESEPMTSSSVVDELPDKMKPKVRKVKQRFEPAVEDIDANAEANESKKAEFSEENVKLTKEDEEEKSRLLAEVENLTSQRKLAAHPEIEKMELCKGKGVYISVLDFANIKAKFMYKAGDLACALMEWVMDKDLLGRTATGWKGTPRIPINVFDSVHIAVQNIMRKATHNPKYIYNHRFYTKSMTQLCNRKNSKAGIKPTKVSVAEPIVSNHAETLGEKLYDGTKKPSPTHDEISDSSDDEINGLHSNDQYGSPCSERDRDLSEDAGDLFDDIKDGRDLRGESRERSKTPSVRYSDDNNGTEERSDLDDKLPGFRMGSETLPRRQQWWEECKPGLRPKKEGKGEENRVEQKWEKEPEGGWMDVDVDGTGWQSRAHRKGRYGQSVQSEDLGEGSSTQAGISQGQRTTRAGEKMETTREPRWNRTLEMDTENLETHWKRREQRESSYEAEEMSGDRYDDGEEPMEQSRRSSGEPSEWKQKPKVDDGLSISPKEQSKRFRERRPLWEKSSRLQNIQPSIEPPEKRRKVAESSDEYPRWNRNAGIQNETLQGPRQNGDENRRKNPVSAKKTLEGSVEHSGELHEQNAKSRDSGAGYWNLERVSHGQRMERGEQDRGTTKRDENLLKLGRGLYGQSSEVSFKNRQQPERRRHTQEKDSYSHDTHRDRWEEDREYERELHEPQRFWGGHNRMSRHRSPDQRKPSMRSRGPPMQNRGPSVRSRGSPMYDRELLTRHREPPIYIREPPMYSREPPTYAREPLMYTRESPMYCREPPVRSRKSPMHSRELVRRNRESPMYTGESPTYTREQPIYTQEQPIYTREPPMYIRETLQQSRGPHKSLEESNEYGERSRSLYMRSPSTHDILHDSRDQPRGFYERNREIRGDHRRGGWRY